jgi:frataxin-like iron-binding protein CyaY
MSDDQFTKLFKYMQAEFAKVNQRLDKSDARFDQVMTGLDAVLKSQETDEQERLVANRQLDQHEDWIVRAAEQLGLSYER